MEKKVLLLDVDEVICFPGFIDAINEFMKTSYVIDDFKDYYLDEVAVPKGLMDEFNRFVNRINLYENAHIIPGAIETIKKLCEVYDVYICSSCVNPFDIEGSGRIFKDKYDFLIRTLPFIEPTHIILTSAKHLFKADIQIDDRLSNLDDSIPVKILFTSYHNKDIEDTVLKERGIVRAGDDWRNAWKAIENILLNKELERNNRTK